MKTFALAAIAVVSAGQAFASTTQACAINPTLAGCSAAVPEISALEGTAALAALAAIVMIAWERSRRAA